MGDDIAIGTFTPGLATNPDPNADYIDLDMLNKHNVIEHDGSMSRRDEYFDPTNPFNAGTFNQFLSYFGNAQTFDVTSISNARARHIQQMSLLNPTMNVTEAREGTSAGECAFMLAVWGSPDNPVAKRSYFEYFFRNERFPVVLGWSPTDTALTVPTLLQIAQDITDASPAGVPLTFAPKAAS
ncbi:putative sterigmatocystin biosynthesis peroxidase stcC [Colletotrichum viniferum]|nr:putative sterigmatocystin biosynthesis peroxidase stcC [Colletotrichum viniferum]